MTSRHNTISTMVVMVSTLISRLLGFLRIAVIGAVFGASGNADVLNLVFNIPNNLRKLLAEGALSSAFIPTLARSHVTDPSLGRSHLLVRQLIGFQLVVLVPIVVISVISPGSITDIILDFPELHRQVLAAELFRWLILYLVLISVAAVLMGTLNSHQSFLVPALAPLLFSFAVIGSILLLHRHMGVFSMVVGVLIGGTAQLIVHIPPVRRRGYRITPHFDFSSPEFKKVLRQWLPVVSTASVFAVNQQIALFFASGLPDGSGSAMTNALVFWQLPFGIFAASITTVLFPTMSRQHALGDTTGLADSIESGLRGLLLLLVPSGIGLAVLGREMIAVALQRGAFSAEATVLAADVLVYYSIGLFSVGGFNFLQRAYYACDDYRTPLKVAVITVILDVLLSLWLKETALAVAGLALANTIAFTVGFFLYLPPIYRHADGFSVQRIGQALLPAAFGSLAAVVVVLLLRGFLPYVGISSLWWSGGSSLKNLGLFLFHAVPAALALVGTYRLFGLKLKSIRRGATDADDIATE
jgi:putative peptidoglycan lipid II flippase